MGRYVRTMGRIHIRIVGGARTAPDTSGDEMGRRRNRLIDMMVEATTAQRGGGPCGWAPT